MVLSNAVPSILEDLLFLNNMLCIIRARDYFFFIQA